MKREQYITPEIEITVISADIITFSETRGEVDFPVVGAKEEP